jgi:proteasome alpha subunit
MLFSGYGFNEADRQRRDHVEQSLRRGSPVVGISFADGLLLLTVSQARSKVFEIYDRLIFSAIGAQADVESIRVGAIEVAHREGYERSPDDVTAQRLVGFSLSPPLKRLFGDQFNAPAVVRALFGELGETPDEDQFFTLNYDGEFSVSKGFSVIAGSPEVEDRMSLELMGITGSGSLDQAVERALRAWTAGSLYALPSEDEEERPQSPSDTALARHLSEKLKSAGVEAGMLERRTQRESRFLRLQPAVIDRAVKAVTHTAE